jgi:hypothetical protein
VTLPNALSRHYFIKNATLEQLRGIRPRDFVGLGAATYFTIIQNSLSRNQQLNCLELLLAPPPQPQQQPRPGRRSSIFLAQNLGTRQSQRLPRSVTTTMLLEPAPIFKLFQARPELLEKRLKLPTPANCDQQKQKRRRL